MTPPNRPRWQFDIQALMAFTMLAAVIAAVVRWSDEILMPAICVFVLAQPVFAVLYLVVAINSPSKDGQLDLRSNAALRSVRFAWLISLGVLMLLSLFALVLDGGGFGYRRW